MYTQNVETTTSKSSARTLVAKIVATIYGVIAIFLIGAAIYDIIFPDPNSIGASFAAVPGMLFTAPLSFVFMPLAGMLNILHGIINDKVLGVTMLTIGLIIPAVIQTIFLHFVISRKKTWRRKAVPQA